MESNIISTPSDARPYRSHKVPACDLCRTRKIRCNVDISGQPCRFCRDRNLACEYKQKSTQDEVVEHAFKRRKTHSSPQDCTTTQQSRSGLSKYPSITGTSPTESSLILNPPMAEDIEVLEHYLASGSSGSATSDRPYSLISSAPGKPIVYLTVPRQRKGRQTTMSVGKAQREIIEQVLGCHKNDVIALYFDKLHPCFPILDEKEFKELWEKDASLLPSALVCDVYASALQFWRTAPSLCQHPPPDLVFIWNQAVAAIQEDFLGSTISTVHASLLDLVGRPVLSITGNVTTVGRTVTLSHSLGLHRDPSSWKATDHEKAIRIRLWWGVVIHDYWSSLAHGTPPLIQRDNCDVPVPYLEALLDSDSSEFHQRSAASFIQLCTLSRILGDLLPYVYALNPDYERVTKSLRRLECLIDGWELALPDFMNPEKGVNGSSNLHFCLLSVKLLLCRVTFKVKAAVSNSANVVVETRSYRLAMLREAVVKLADYVISLQPCQLEEFWLPWTAHLLVSATTILLRCLLESSDLSTKRDCASKLVKLKNRLQLARDESSWDLAEFCLDRCSEPINKIATAMGLPQATMASTSPDVTPTTQLQGSLEHDIDLPSLATDFYFPVDSFGYPFDAFWDVNA